jgi:hypothetical protein
MTKKRRVQEFIASRGWTFIGEAEWAELSRELPDIPETTVRDAGVAIAAPWSGVAQHSLNELAESLIEFSAVYAARSDLRRYCRHQVIAAKDRARFAARSSRVDPDKRHLKAEMVDWMLVWLDDPAMFSTWVELRLRQPLQPAEPPHS